MTRISRHPDSRYAKVIDEGDYASQVPLKFGNRRAIGTLIAVPLRLMHGIIAARNPMQSSNVPGESTTGGDGTESDDCCAPTGTTFVPDNNDFQTMMCVTDTLVNCPGDKGSDGSTTQSDDNDKDEAPRTTEKPKEPEKAPEPETVVNAEGVSVTTERHPNGKIKSITKQG